jgi:hypothetical protein
VNQSALPGGLVHRSFPAALRFLKTARGSESVKLHLSAYGGEHNNSGIRAASSKAQWTCSITRLVIDSEE